jgi:tRNA-splicing ligase RtcB
MKVIDGAAVFGAHDDTTLNQLRDVASRAERAALMADGHVGYVMPIGGVAAYREQVSVVGVGFDIACLAAGTPVTTCDGYSLPIERVSPADAVACWDGDRVRPATPHVGAVARGVRPTVRVRLANGRALVATPDHRIRARRGWLRADELAVGDSVACVPHVGVAYETPADVEELDLAVDVAGELARRGLNPLRGRDPRFATVVRLLGVVSGDGHLARDGKSVSVYTTDERDAVDIATDFAALGFRANVYRRARGPGRKVEVCVRVHSRALHALFEALGSPRGRKRWPADPMPWLRAAPAWVRAHFMSAFASAEMTTPRMHANGTVPNLQLKQAGEDTHAIDFVAGVLASLGFAASVAPSGRPYGSRRVHVAQILGGEAEQLRFFADVGFCYAAAKRIAAARVASVVWQHQRYVRTRESAKAEARALQAGGTNWRAATRDVADRFGVTPGFVHHAIYDRRGRSRRTPGLAVEPDTDAEVCWEPVEAVDAGPPAAVFDVVTGDPAQSFVADGVVVHNCGNAAIRTSLTMRDFGGDADAQHRTLALAADEIQRAVSFGVGRKNRADDAPVDHPLFGDDAWAAVPVKERKTLKTKARQQLGTVGSGNHYVDVFADEAGTIWVGVHFGSRGFGHTVASGFLALGQNAKWGERVPEREVLLDLAAPVGHDYFALMNLAGRYAYAGREWVARKVVEILGGREEELVHNHHNFAWRETHGGEELVVVRKGATPAFPGQLGFVGGSMGDDAVIVRGAAAGAGGDVVAAQLGALYSTVHGAGRVMSRTQAAGKRNRKTGQVISPGRVTPEMMHEWISTRGVILRGGGLDESPHAYRRLPEVLAAQGATVEVVHTLRPLVVVMAGAEEFDPYKD